MNHESVMKIFLTTAGITMLWTSCKKIDGPATPNVDPVVINLSLTVSSPEVKATDNSFEEGDQIGLYVSYDGDLKEQGNYYDNKKFTLRAGHWTADTELYWKDQTSDLSALLYLDLPANVGRNLTCCNNLLLSPFNGGDEFQDSRTHIVSFWMMRGKCRRQKRDESVDKSVRPAHTHIRNGR